MAKAKANKKIIFGVITLIVIIIVITLLVVFTKSSNILLKNGATLSSKICSQLEDVTVIHAAGCSACAIALPRLRELEEELGMDFGYYDMAIDEDKEKILGLGLIPEAVPTCIINCRVYVGVRNKEEYLVAILG